MLSQVAARLRQGGEAFRLGGDEFAVLLVGMEEHVALATTESILARIAETELGQAGAITVSAGVATYPQHADNAVALLEKAAAAMSTAKQQCVNGFQLYGSADGKSAAALMRNCLTHPAAAKVMRDQVMCDRAATVTAKIDAPDAELRAALFGATMIGLGMARYLIELEPLASASREDIERLLAPALAALLT